jgi:hypothetical protein
MAKKRSAHVSAPSKPTDDLSTFIKQTADTNARRDSIRAQLEPWRSAYNADCNQLHKALSLIYEEEIDSRQKGRPFELDSWARHLVTMGEIIRKRHWDHLLVSNHDLNNSAVQRQ